MRLTYFRTLERLISERQKTIALTLGRQLTRLHVLRPRYSWNRFWWAAPFCERVLKFDLVARCTREPWRDTASRCRALSLTDRMGKKERTSSTNHLKLLLVHTARNTNRPQLTNCTYRDENEQSQTQ